MKRCANCNKEFDDSKMFCPECGNPLSYAASGTSGTTAPSGFNGNLNTAGRPVTPAPESPWYVQWKGTILAVIGLIVEWEWNVVLGVALVVTGFILDKDSQNPGNKAVTAVLLVIGIIMFIVYLAA